jgi:hypothetical protein
MPTTGNQPLVRTTYKQLLTVLADGDWHSLDELEAVTRYPDQWLTELRHEGHQVGFDSLGRPLVRLGENGHGRATVRSSGM